MVTPLRFFRLLPQRHYAWLLWLALLLPAAQLAASCHALSHVAGAVGDARGDAAPPQLHCDLCFTAAAVAGGAAPSVPTSWPQHALAGQQTPATADRGVVAASPQRAYLSRAPPFAGL